MEIQKTLENVGLNQKQACAYIACLKLGTASAYKIAKQANLPRSTCYEILDSLHQKNLITKYKRKNIIYYSPENPSELIVNEKEKIELIQKALPELRGLYMSIKNQPSTRIFEGEEGMKIILKEIVNEAKEIKGFSSVDDMFSVLQDYWSKYLEDRIKNKIPAKILYTDSPRAKERKFLGPKHLREVKILPSDYKPEGLIVIWNDKVASFSFSDKMMALIITSKQLAQTQTMMFDFIWNHC